MIDSASSDGEDERTVEGVDALIARLRRAGRPALFEMMLGTPEFATQLHVLIPAWAEAERCGSPPGSCPPSHVPEPAASDPGAGGRLPERLGDYVIIRWIGGGGMGVVYEAEHASLKSRVALKVMHPRFRADPKYLRRFHAEARVAAGLHHTNIVSVFDYGDQDGVCFYAMQFIDGQPLDQVLAAIRRVVDERTQAEILRGPGAMFTFPAAAALTARSRPAEGLVSGHFTAAPACDGPVEHTEPIGTSERVFSVRSATAVDSPRTADSFATEPTSASGTSSLGSSGEHRYFGEIARIGAQVADAMEYAHRRGVLHRDIKPSNLLLDAFGNVWVADFGLAKLEEGDDLSQSRELVGTLRYMAPERFRRTSERRGDIYSLGATLYELLTLRPPFDDTDQIRIIERIRTEPPLPPRRLDRSIPRDLETIVLKALAKDPKDRFGSAGELADELRRFVEGRPIRSRPVSVVEQLWRWCKRDPWLAGANITAALLTVVLAVVSSVASVVYWNQARELRVERGRSDAVALDARWRAVDAYMAQAQAGRFSRRPGQRFESLKAVSQATRLLDDLPGGPESDSRRESLRDLAVAAIALPDVKPSGRALPRPAGVIMAAFNHAMTRYALRFRDGRISVRRVVDDREVAGFSARGNRVEGVFTFSPDGRYLVATHLPQTGLTVWEIERGVVALSDSTRVAHGVAAKFSPDSRRIAVGHENRYVVVYDLATGKPSARWNVLVPPKSLAFHPDGKRIAVINNDSKPPTCVIHEVETGRIIRTYSLRTSAQDVAWSSDGTTIAMPGMDRKIYLWDAASGTLLASLEGHTSGGLEAAFHPENTLLASRDWSGQLRIWDPVLGHLWLTLNNASPEFSRDGQLVALREDRILTYQVDPALEYRTLAHAPRDAMDYERLSVRHDGRLLAVGTEKGAALWDLDRGDELAFLPIGNAWHLTFESSGDLITSGTKGVLRWPIRLDVDRGEFKIGPARTLPLPAGNYGIGVDSSAQIVAKASKNYAYVTTNAGQSRVGPLNDCRGVAVSADGQWLATGTHLDSQGAQVWRVRDLFKAAELPVTQGTRVEFSPDGKWLMTLDPSCRLWEVGTWRMARQIGGRGCCFSPDGRLIVVNDANDVIHLVETESGRTLTRLESPDSSQTGWVTFSPDGSRLVVTSPDGPAVHVWDLRAIRQQLDGMGLDWDAPAYSAAAAGRSSAPLPPLRIDLGWECGLYKDLVPRAEALFQELTAQIKSQPGDADACHQRAHALFTLHRSSEAVDDLTRAIHLRPDVAHYRAIRGAIYFDQKKYESAISDLETAQALEPDQEGVRDSLARSCNALAWVLANGPSPRWEFDRALALGHRAVALVPDDSSPLNTLGVVMYRAMRYEEAIVTMEKSLQVVRGRVEGYNFFFLAMAHHRLGRRAEARARFDQGVRSLLTQKSLDVSYKQELAGIRAEAEAVLAGPAGDLPGDVFAPTP